MPSILPPTSDTKAEARRLTCPVCGLPDSSPSVRVEHLGTMRADCICPNEHLFVVRWNEAA